MHTNTCGAEDPQPPAPTAPLHIPSAQGREVPRTDFADHVEERDPLRGEGVVFVDTGVTITHRHTCCSWARRICVVLALALTLYLIVDVYLACWDLYKYGTQPDPYDEGYNKALWWLWCFVPALLECGAMIVFLLRELCPFSCCRRPVPTNGSVNDAENGNTHRARDERVGAVKRGRMLNRCALLVTFSLFTAVAYLYNFRAPFYPLSHLVLHVRCIWVTLLRSLFLFLYALTIILD
ncbi:hypothetical protein ABB37_09679 [Leptomonas pyrrhocoris]|uniref:Uncharacterized protein n=1 Tax=Leptomonas pyrrhocoris TaxID=157538 RepID=A0A0M9FQ98_LEPPY|nr:hypothetical protein ABB37_09679 [Leptomonas pyrrhocoris]KPA73797.1 hypothetical protein ABB37_09679 [Leptomonas pyrrhocoris]|eukprot:XP_015652236.1 hypothetical protein ABB37_09679 [Leptomonas pyrrhocoris]